jgi:hypothetical protein
MLKLFYLRTVLLVLLMVVVFGRLYRKNPPSVVLGVESDQQMTSG